MARGIKKLEQLSNAIVPVEPATPITEPSPYEKKVLAIIARYYYYLSTPAKMRTDEILQRLSDEFYLTTGRIADIIYDESAAVEQLRKDKPQKEWFKIKWAHIAW